MVQKKDRKYQHDWLYLQPLEVGGTEYDDSKKRWASSFTPSAKHSSTILYMKDDKQTVLRV